MKNLSKILFDNLGSIDEIIYAIDLKDSSVEFIGDIDGVIKKAKIKSPCSLANFAKIFALKDAEKFLSPIDKKTSKYLRNLKLVNENLPVKDEGAIIKQAKNSIVIGHLQKTGKEVLNLDSITPEFDEYSPSFYSHLNQLFDSKKKAQNLVLRVHFTNLVLLTRLYSKTITENIVQDFSNQITKLLPKTAKLFRTSIDTISIIIPEAKEGKNIAEELSQNIHNIAHNFHFPNTDRFLHLNVLVGHSFFPLEFKTTQDVLVELYLACHKSLIYKPNNGLIVETKNFIEKEKQDLDNLHILEKAYFDRKLSLVYQPIVRTKTGQIAHYEALLRYREAGMLKSVGLLIPTAEKFGRINKIDIYVLEKVIEELNKDNSPVLSFNVSNVTTDDPIWIKTIQKHLHRNQNLAKKLMIEITETAAQRDLRQTAYFIASMQALGCKVALDDFGTGYTSFHQLKYLSLDVVKIDGIYIRNLKENTENYLFIKTLLDFSKSYGLETVAEFVESGEVAKILMSLGVDYLQGYFFGKPEPMQYAKPI
jgi:EAL domain-containing protein (putative c-di-GMP-specific phosphodiesterase class I)